MTTLKRKLAIIISIVLSLVIVLTFASCGFGGSSEETITDTDKEEDVLVNKVIFKERANDALEVCLKIYLLKFHFLSFLVEIKVG